MPKSKIIKDIADGKADLETSLSRLYLLASDVNDTALMEWAEKELIGYNASDTIPDYRKTRSHILRYSGLNNGFQATNATLQLGVLSEATRELISKVRVAESVKSISEHVATGTDIKRDLGMLIEEVYENSGEEIQCTSIYQIVPLSFYRDILSNVKQKIIQELLKLEKEHGCLDSLEIQSDDDPENIAFWNNINDRIKRQSRELYSQCFYKSAAQSAVQEVETRLREMFRELKNVSTEPTKIEDVIGGLLSERGAFRCCDTESKDGKNFSIGFDKLVRGFITAYRNPLSHINHVLSKQDAFEIITLSSIIMNTLDNGCGWIEGNSE